jgi:phospholipid/cholesterol/gamma-HCH transport system substrate-binding protein
MKKYAHETVVGIFVILGLAAVGYMAVKLGDVSLLGEDSYLLYAEFNSVSGLRVDNPVEIFGMEVGRVAGFRMDQDNQVVVVELRIKNHVKVHDDAIAAIKTAGLIGDKYVSIDPGGADEVLKPGETIIDTQSPIDIGEVIGKYAFGQVQEKGIEGKGKEK